MGVFGARRQPGTLCLCKHRQSVCWFFGGNWLMMWLPLVHGLFFFLAVPCGLQDLSALTGTWTLAWELKAPSPNHWMAREFAFTCHFNDVGPSPPPGVTTYLSPLSLPELILIMHPRYSNAVVSWIAHSMPKKKEPTLNPGFSSLLENFFHCL